MIAGITIDGKMCEPGAALTAPALAATFRGETSPIARISDADAREVHRLSHEEGVTQTTLAARFGVSQQLVSRIVRAERRYTWLS